MREQLQDIHDTLQSDSIDAEGLPDYLTSPAALYVVPDTICVGLCINSRRYSMEDADSESRQPTVES